MEKKIIVIIALVFAMIEGVKAQSNPLLNQYFVNKYLSNPAMAGFEKGGNMDLSYRNQWNGIEGAPKIQNLSANYGWEKVGVGLILNSDQSGLQRQTRVLATYAYHLPLNSDGMKLHFGLSAGFLNERIDMNDIVGNQNDQKIGEYNARNTYVDGDFGLGISDRNWTLDFALVNLKNYLKKDFVLMASTPTMYISGGYDFELNPAISFNPKIAYRDFKEMKGVVDVGANLAIANKQLLIMGMYHTNKSASYGIGLNFKNKYKINSYYTTQTGELSRFTNGGFEIGVGIKW
jgi:type IX secretion system PorP/SprF family membrane protein